MNLENILYYVTHHSESIIQWLFLAILLLAGVVIARAIFGPKTSSASSAAFAGVDAGGSDIQAFLQKIMEQTSKLERAPLASMTPGEVGQVDTQVQALKAELASRDEEISKLKTGGAGGAVPGGATSEDADKVAARIKELEAKLAEYEILEDDIADLSLYKEENARLKVELDKVKSAPPAAAAAPAASPGDDIVAEFAQAVNQETTGGGATVEVSATGNPMDDFESAMKLEKKMMGEDAAPASAAPAPAPVHAAFAAAAAPATPPVTEADDLFAEFAAPAEPEPTPAPDLDTDKMMEEMAALANMDHSTAAGASALEDGIDTEKMAQEATKLVK